MTQATDSSAIEIPIRRITGYADRLSVRAGDTLRFMVSSETPYEASIVRLVGAPHNRDDGWEETVSWSASIAGRYPGRAQATDAGSYAVVPGCLLPCGRGFTLQAAVFATTPDCGRDQFILGQWSEAEGRGAALKIDENGCLSLVSGDGEQTRHLTADTPLPARQWLLVTATHDARTGQTRLRQVPLTDSPARPVTAEANGTIAPAGPETPFAIAARLPALASGTLSRDHFNGKIDSPRVLSRDVTDAEAERLLADPHPSVWKQDLVAAWDFSIDIPTHRIADTGPNRHDGVLINLPARAMTGWRWNGQAYDWTRAPEHYGAIHFHEDDLYDARWESDFGLTIPDGTASGVYAARLDTGTETEYIPFFVAAPAAAADADLLFLVPTASYLAYGNEHLGMDVGETEALSGHLTVLQKNDIHLGIHREIGLSLYDTHADGSGVCYSSALRPLLNLRPGKNSSWIGSNPRAPWQFNADLDLIAFLETQGFRYDVATDEDLHREGLGLLSRYRTVMTGSHPEYYSTVMLDSIQGYTDRGGRFMYMGGNGFYWRIAFSDSAPGAIELRRAEDGIRDWTCEPGEYYHSFSGELGGLWRRIGRSPQALVGVGMAAQGFDYSGWFRKASGAHDPRAAFAFAGIDSDIIGDFGHVGGGAAGLEMDRADFSLGTPPHALILASSEGHSNLTFAVPEEVDNVSDELVATRNRALRGDVVFFETSEGGAVFSTGSIAWAGSLSHAGYDNSVARLTTNVLTRFLDPAPFPAPDAG
jgi:N,N-dimethylformamidase